MYIYYVAFIARVLIFTEPQPCARQDAKGTIFLAKWD